MTHRPVELVLGVLTLVSVISIPIRPKSVSHPPVIASAPHVDLDRLERVQQEALSQEQEVARLARDTRALAELVSSRNGFRPSRESPLRSRLLDAGTVETSPPKGAETENEYEYGCSQ